MYQTLKTMYDDGKITKTALKVAVSTKGWITPAEYQKITGEAYVG